MRVCVVVTRKEREREECALHRAMMMMQNSSFFLLGWLLSERREGEKKNSSETLNPNFQKCLLFEVHFFDLSEKRSLASIRAAKLERENSTLSHPLSLKHEKKVSVFFLSLSSFTSETTGERGTIRSRARERS